MNSLPPSKINNSNEVNEKKHRNTFTQRLSFKQLNESGKRETEKIKVVELLSRSAPLTSRQITSLISVERTNITRTLRDLQDEGKVRVAHIAPCEKTGKKVQYYTTDTPLV